MRFKFIDNIIDAVHTLVVCLEVSMVVSFQYLLGEDADSVDQFQVLAHPKVHIIISLDILMQVQCMWILF